MLKQLNAHRWLKKFEFKEFPEPERIILNYPVLLCHGYGAVTMLAKPSPLYDVAMLMRTHHVLAFAPNIFPYTKIEERAKSWVKLIYKLVDELQCEKLNIVAHSMGGLDMRYALARLNIASALESLTTVATPHRGSSLAELAPETVHKKIAHLLNWIGDHVYPETISDSAASARQLTREYMSTRFNPEIPDVGGVPFYSYSAAVGKGTHEPIGILVRYQNNRIYQEEGLNDGMVSVQSAQWGDHIKTGNISHLEQVNFNVKKERRPLFKAFWLDIIKMLQSNKH